MVRHEPWQFFIFKFTDDNGKHTVSVGAADPIEAVELIANTDMYSNIRDLRIIPRGEVL
jgi:hypothetical protein